MKKILFILILLFSVGVVSAIDITNCADLSYYLYDSGTYDCSGNYELTANIDASCLGIDRLCEHTPFSGTLDGKGYYIYDRSFTLNRCGLFEDIVGGTVQNLGIIDMTCLNIGSGSSFGFLAGKCYDCTIENVFVKDSSMSGSNLGHSGCLVNTLENAGKINNSYTTSNNITTSTSGNNLGGFVRRVLSGEIYNSYSADNALIGGSFSGGVASWNSDYINNTYSHLTNNPALQVAYSSGTPVFTNALGVTVSNGTFDITSYTLAELGDWGESVWCIGTKGYPLLLYNGVEMEGQGDTCESQGPGGDEVIPEFSNTGKIAVTVIALIVVAMVAMMLMKKKQPEQQ